MQSIYQKIIERCLEENVSTEKEFSAIKRHEAKNFKIPLPSNVVLLKFYHSLLKKGTIKKNEEIEKILIKRKIRSLSGVVVVSVLTKPYPCPGKCIYCPFEKGIPKSYISGEPAVERAKRLNYNPYLQVKKRIESLEKQGHPTDKVELRIIGGSWSAYQKKYQSWFISRCFAAANAKPTAEDCRPKNERSKGEKSLCRCKNKEIASLSLAPLEIRDFLTGRAMTSLEKEQKKNEKVKHRIVGISIETRPDLIDEKEILNLRKLGVTMVEIGVQTIFDDILKKCKRGHGAKEIAKATKMLKDAGFKVMYQMMPNLPGSNLKRDINCFKILFEDERFKPDWLKIYPCLVCEGSKLYQIWKEGKYKPYSCQELISILIKIKKKFPYWVKVARLFRDIPASKIKAGCKISNLREVVQKEMEKKNIKCRCIRCREIREDFNEKEKVYLIREDYDASNGKEIFLSIETERRGKKKQNNRERKLYSFLRLRIPSYIFDRKRHFIPSLQCSAIIREIHTFGQLVPLLKKKKAPQHRGFGEKLVKEAEKIAKKDYGVSKIAVISGIGAREYWRKLGYKLKNSYMVKKLTTNN